VTAAGVLVPAVCLARVHVGAHLPLDVAGGAALGLAVGGAVRLALGHPR
jgi:membrane-associated phospholipid phosphatase